MMNIMISGVGGQGSLLASRILGKLYLDRGCDVKVSEVHGMSQRGGSVITFVRAGEAVASPLVPVGEADLLIAFEQMEAIRYLHYMKPGGTVVTSVQKIPPMPVIAGTAIYDGDIIEKIGASARRITVDALSVAEAAGSAKASNVAALGAASGALDFSEDAWLGALRALAPPRFIDLNIQAFKSGAASAEVFINNVSGVSK